MNRNTIIIGVIIFLAIGGIVWIALNDSDSSGTSATPTVTASPAPTVSATVKPSPKTAYVHLTTRGVSPSSLTVSAGDVLVFVNDTDSSFWPISNTSACIGLDARRGLLRGERYTVALSQAMQCSYYDYQAPYDQSRMGTITIR